MNFPTNDEEANKRYPHLVTRNFSQSFPVFLGNINARQRVCVDVCVSVRCVRVFVCACTRLVNFYCFSQRPV